MKLRGVNYDVGIEFTPAYHSRPVFDPAATERDLVAIRDELHANAVRISGTDPQRLAVASRMAFDLGLEVWFSPHLHDRVPDKLVAYTAECAAAECPAGPPGEGDPRQVRRPGDLCVSRPASR